ncbi:hypothetical protein Sru01_58310 [Sphaerisporangium rufum]|uniref:DUF4871 domain-containing protein n=1 Tax=Sphaerisporangium rufum TaxID=1381558 RepID=A0A919V2L0_9ACTN|nr:hypothetical protein [Sphaerisporangium rufum]GII80849.1 hypothetical protein Sru01_58310 [Sphaerisporangium rufum]
MRRTTALLACLAAAACTAPAATTTAGRTAPASPVPAAATPAATAATPATSGRAIKGGCGTGTIRTGAAPSWATEGAPPDTPYVVGTAGEVLGYLFVRPLRAGKPTSPSNKILWYVRQAGEEMRLTIHPRGADRPVVRATFPAAIGPGEIYPSTVDVPGPGCWTVEFAWGSRRDSVDLRYRR